MGVKVRQFKIMLQLWKATIIQSMEYRVSFVFSLIANALDFIFGFLQYLVFFTAAQSIAGWDANQMLVLYGVFMLVFALHFIFLYPNLAAMGDMVNSGSLDLLLTKPVNAQIMVSFRRISLEELGSLATATMLLAWLTARGTIVWSVTACAHFATGLLCSLIIIYCGFLVLISLAILMEKLDNITQLLWSFFSLYHYPIDIYPKRIQHVFFSFLPVAFISTVPAAALLGRAELHTTFLGIAVTLLALILSSWLWKITIRAYTSAGG